MLGQPKLLVLQYLMAFLDTGFRFMFIALRAFVTRFLISYPVFSSLISRKGWYRYQ